MVGVEEVLAVVAGLSETTTEQRVDEFRRVHRGVLAQLPHQGGEQPVAVVFDALARNTYSVLEGLVLDGVVVHAQVLDHSVAEPLPERGRVTEPPILLGGITGRHGQHELVEVGLNTCEGILERRAVTDEEVPQVLLVDNHLNAAP